MSHEIDPMLDEVERLARHRELTAGVANETLADLADTAERAAAYPCLCPATAHHNALHDLAREAPVVIADALAARPTLPAAAQKPTIHTWGFFDGHDPRLPNGSASSSESVTEAWQRLSRHIAHFGGAPEKVRSTTLLGGGLVRVEFETAPRDRADRMWHVIERASEGWPDFPDREG